MVSGMSVGVGKRRLAAIFGLILLGAGFGILLFLPVSATAPNGYGFRCGNAVRLDDAAIKAYYLDELAKGLETSLTPSIGTAPPVIGGTRPALGRRDDQDLTTICRSAMSRQFGWSTALILAGSALITFGIAARIKALADGGRLPTWMRKCPEWVTIVTFAASGAIGLMVDLTDGAAQWIWVGLAVLLFAVGAVLVYARATETKRQKDWIREAEDSHRADVRNLLGNQLYNLLLLVIEAVSTEVTSERKTLAHSARVAILAAAANLVGQRASSGTRANLFKFNEYKQLMALEAGCFAGGDRSGRVFRSGDETYDLALQRKGRFVEDVSEIEGGDQLAYETFLTYPVYGTDRLHGVLTVDCQRKGELVEDEDAPMMSVLAALLAITYESEKYPRPRL